MYIGERIEELRKERGLSQRQLAKMAGLSNGALWRIEKQNGDITLRSLHKVAEALDITEDDLIYGLDFSEKEK